MVKAAVLIVFTGHVNYSVITTEIETFHDVKYVYVKPLSGVG